MNSNMFNTTTPSLGSSTQEVTGQSVFWAIAALTITAMSQRSLTGLWALNACGLPALPFSPERSSPLICLLDGIAELLILTKSMVRGLKKRIFRASLVKEDTQTRLIEQPNHLALILKSAFFLLVASTLALKLLSMRGIPLTQCYAVILLSAAVINTLFSLLHRHVDSEYMAVVSRFRSGRWQPWLRVLSFIGHIALYAILWAQIARYLTLPDTPRVRQVVSICSWIGRPAQFLHLVFALPWILGPFFTDRVGKIQPWAIRGVWVFLFGALFLVPAHSMTKEAGDPFHVRHLPQVTLLRWTLPPATAAATAYLFSRILIGCTNWVFRGPAAQGGAFIVKSIETNSHAQPLHGDNEKQNETAEAQDTLKTLSDVDFLEAQLRYEVEQKNEENESLEAEVTPLSADLETIQKLARHVRKHTLNSRLLLSGLFPSDSDMTRQSLVARMLWYTLHCCICIIQAPIIVCGYIVITMSLFMNGLPVILKSLDIMFGMDRRVFWVAFAVYNFMTALLYVGVAFDGRGAVNRSWTSFLG